MPDDGWIWKEWSRQCTVAIEAIKRGDLAEADEALAAAEALESPDVQKPADIPPAGLW